MQLSTFEPVTAYSYQHQVIVAFASQALEMKIVITFAALLCAFCVFTGTKALPAVSLENALDVAAAGDAVEQEPGQLATLPSRQKRATCDLLSGTGLNHSACAAHCVLRGNRGGYCSSKAVCTCRN